MTHDSTIKELFTVAGDQPDPGGTGARGISTGFDFTATALGHPMLLYRASNGKELVLEADIYMGPTGLYIHLICPECLLAGRTNALRIVESQKAMSYEPDLSPPPFPGWTKEQMLMAFPVGSGGMLSIEPFRCTWEEVGDLRRGHGLAQCPWSVAIERNFVRLTR